MAGLFVTFEGGEGAGKSTVLARVASILRQDGRKVLTTREPGSGEFGAAVRQLLLHSGEIPPRSELLLFLADRANHVSTVIKPALARGEVVLCDRFADSTMVYQAMVRGLDRDFVVAGNRFAVGDTWPSRTYLLDIETELGLKRAKGGDRLDAMPLAFHQAVRQGFLELAQQEPDRWLLVDASQPSDTVLEVVLADLRTKLDG
jgi:dTMP kinase